MVDIWGRLMGEDDPRTRLETLDREWDQRRAEHTGKRGEQPPSAVGAVLGVPVAASFALLWVYSVRGVGFPAVLEWVGWLLLPYAGYRALVAMRRYLAYRSDKREYEARRWDLVAVVAALPAPEAQEAGGGCAYCGGDLPATALPREYGLEVCAACRETDRRSASVQEAGWTVQTRRWRERHTRRSRATLADGLKEQSVVFHCIGLDVGAPNTRPVEVQFTRQNLDHRIEKLFTEEVEAGDPFFDDLVYVTTSDAVSAAALLADDGVRAAITDLVQEGAYITVDAAGVHARICSPEQRSPGDYSRPVFALVRHLLS